MLTVLIILLLILIPLTAFSSLLEDFVSPDELDSMGVLLGPK